MPESDIHAPLDADPTQTRRRPLLAFTALLGLAIVLLVLLWDWNWFKRPIEHRVSEAIGRQFRIDGDLSVKLGWHPRLSFEGVRLANLPGNAEPQMASAQLVQFRLHPLPLLRGDWVLSEVKLLRPRLLLEKNRADVPNWLFKRGKGEWPTINQLSIDDGQLRYRNPLRNTDMAFALRSGQPGKDSRLAPLLVEGSGKYVGSTLEVEGRVDSPWTLKDSARPYHVDMRARAGATRATAEGSLIAPLQLKGFDLRFGLSGPSLALLYPLIGVAAPETPPYHLLGQLTHEKNVWHYREFTGVVGDSDLAGDATFLTGGKRPKLVADLVSKRLDFDDLGGFVGAPPQTGGKESASAAQLRESAQLHASARVLPDSAFHLDKIRGMDADVKLRAQHIDAPSLPLEAMTAHLYVDDGVLRLDPLDFRAADGEIRSRIRMDARKSVIASSVRIHADGLSLPKLLPGVQITKDSVGRIGGNLELAGNGNSVARMLAGSDGDVALRMGSGRISNLLMEKAGIDIQETLKFLIGKDRSVPIRCAFGEFDVKDGLMRTRAFAFDTSDTVVLGDGSISLREERYDLRLRPLPKDHSLLALRAPLMLTGTFKEPSFHVDIARVTLKVVAAAVLAGITPPAALIATYERGPGKDVACRPGERFAEAQKKWNRAAIN
jgi:uncharacterized protein involved in outer membrane biogenesis